MSYGILLYIQSDDKDNINYEYKYISVQYLKKRK